MLRGLKLGPLGALAFTVVGTAVAQSNANYTYTQLPSSSGSVMLGLPIVINRDGSLLRQAAYNCELGYATVNGGVTTYHGLPTGSYVMGMNSLLQVVGNDANGEAFVENRNGGVTTLTNLKGRAWAINDAGILTGQTGTNGYSYESDKPVAMKSLDYPGAYSTIVRAVSNNYSFAGSYFVNGKTHGWTNIGHYTTVDFPGAAGTYCSSINYYGDVVGSYLTGSTTGMTEGGFLLKNGIYSRFVVSAPPTYVTVQGCMGSSETYKLNYWVLEPTSINDFDDVVGGRIGYYTGMSSGTKITQVWSFKATPS